MNTTPHWPPAPHTTVIHLSIIYAHLRSSAITIWAWSLLLSYIAKLSRRHGVAGYLQSNATVLPVVTSYN